MPKKKSGSNSNFDSDESIDLESLANEFASTFPTEQACLSELYRLVGIDDGICHACGSSNIEKTDSNRSAHCLSCKDDTWFTAGTILKQMKLPTPRLAKIWFESRGVSLSAAAHGRLLKIAYASAHGIKIWFDEILVNALPDDTASFHSSHFRAVICKRSLQTPQLEHPRAEIDQIEQTEPLLDQSDQDIQPSLPNGALNSTIPEETGIARLDDWQTNLLNEPNQVIVQNLLSKTPIRFNALHQLANLPTGELLASISILELCGKAKCLPDNTYIACQPKPKLKALTEESLTLIEDFMQFVRDTYHGISRKFLQLYTAAFWYHRNRQQLSIEHIMQAALRTNPNIASTRAYLSPAFVKLS